MQTSKNQTKNRVLNAQKMVKVSLLGAISFAFMALDFSVPIFPNFLKFDISDLPSLIGGFAMGPVVAILIQLVKVFMKFAILGSNTAGVGELSNFIIGSSFAVTASVVYFKNKQLKSAIIGFILATIVMSLLGILSNYFVMLPLYSTLFKIPLDSIIAMGTAINPLIHSKLTLVLLSILPFNIIKGIIISLLTLLIYKRISPLLK